MSDRQEILNYAGAIVAVMLLITLGFLSYALVFVEIPVGNNNTLTILVGILSANVGTVVGFFFGSSASAKKQTETIDTMARSQAASANTPESTVTLAPGESATVSAEGNEGDVKKT